MCTSCSPSSTRRATASAQRMARSRSLTDRPTDRLIRCHSLRKRSDFGRLRRDERVAQHQEGPSCWPTASVGSAGAVETRHDVVTGWNANDQKTRGRCRLSRDCDVPVTLAVQSRLLSLCLRRFLNRIPPRDLVAFFHATSGALTTGRASTSCRTAVTGPSRWLLRVRVKRLRGIYRQQVVVPDAL